MERLKKLRKQAGLSKSKVSRATGLSEVTISRIEKGITSTRVETLEVLSDFYGASPAYALGGYSVPEIMDRLERNLWVSNGKEQLLAMIKEILESE